MSSMNIDKIEKLCPECGITKSVFAFNRNSGRFDGLQGICRECQHIRGKAYNETHPEIRVNYRQQHKEEKSISDRLWRENNQEHKASTDRLYYQNNREKIIDRVTAYYQENKEERINYIVEWGRQNPDKRSRYNKKYNMLYPEKVSQNSRTQNRKRRAREKSVQTIFFTEEQWLAKVDYWGNKCWRCGGLWDSQDHVKPISKGGAHMLANLRPICRSCNSRKSNQWPLT